MSNDYTSKVAVFEHEGMESLIRCMTENDPDVQKNSVEAISSLLQVGSSTAAYPISSEIKIPGLSILFVG